MRCTFLPVLDAEGVEEIEEENGSIFLILYIIVLAKNSIDWNKDWVAIFY
jgi:hypothetical protein